MPNNSEPLIDVLDEFGICTGEKLSRREIHLLGKIHRPVHLYLFDKVNNLLLQRRSFDRDHYPGAYSISLTGHVDAGESSSEALYREIKEELNLDPKTIKIDFLFSFRQDTQINPTYIDRQFNDVYACWHDFNIMDIAFNPNEISELKLVPFSEFMEIAHNELSTIYGRECKDVAYFLRSILNK